MKKLLYVMLATSLPLVNDTQAGDPPLHPDFRLSRQDEDWTALRDPELRSNLVDRVKFIPLNRDGSSWLTLGGEARERYEYFENANWGKGPQDGEGYFLHRVKSSRGSGFPNLQTYRFIFHRFCPGHR